LIQLFKADKNIYVPFLIFSRLHMYVPFGVYHMYVPFGVSQAMMNASVLKMWFPISTKLHHHPTNFRLWSYNTLHIRATIYFSHYSERLTKITCTHTHPYIWAWQADNKKNELSSVILSVLLLNIKLIIVTQSRSNLNSLKVKTCKDSKNRPLISPLIYLFIFFVRGD
jgi:hypothetical protein